MCRWPQHTSRLLRMDSVHQVWRVVYEEYDMCTSCCAAYCFCRLQWASSQRFYVRSDRNLYGSGLVARKLLVMGHKIWQWGPVLKMSFTINHITWKLVTNSHRDFARFWPILSKITQIPMLSTSRSWIIIGNGANNADGAQGLVMGHKPLVMGYQAPAATPWQRACTALIVRS